MVLFPLPSSAEGRITFPWEVARRAVPLRGAGRHLDTGAGESGSVVLTKRSGAEIVTGVRGKLDVIRTRWRARHVPHVSHHPEVVVPAVVKGWDEVQKVRRDIADLENVQSSVEHLLRHIQYQQQCHTDTGLSYAYPVSCVGVGHELWRRKLSTAVIHEVYASFVTDLTKMKDSVAKSIRTLRREEKYLTSRTDTAPLYRHHEHSDEVCSHPSTSRACSGIASMCGNDSSHTKTCSRLFTQRYPADKYQRLLNQYQSEVQFLEEQPYPSPSRNVYTSRTQDRLRTRVERSATTVATHHMAHLPPEGDGVQFSDAGGVPTGIFHDDGTPVVFRKAFP